MNQTVAITRLQHPYNPKYKNRQVYYNNKTCNQKQKKEKSIQIHHIQLNLRLTSTVAIFMAAITKNMILLLRIIPTTKGNTWEAVKFIIINQKGKYIPRNTFKVMKLVCAKILQYNTTLCGYLWWKIVLKFDVQIYWWSVITIYQGHYFQLYLKKNTELL